MPLVDVPPFPVPSGPHPTTASPTRFTLDASGESVAFMFYAPKTGTIDRLYFWNYALTSSGNADVRLETVTSGGRPSGTLVGTNTNVTVTINAAPQWVEGILTSGASVTQGQYVAAVLKRTTGSYQIVSCPQFTAMSAYSDNHYPGPALGLGYLGLWSSPYRNPFGAVRYSDGTYPPIPGLWPFYSTTGGGDDVATTMASNTTPDEVALKFVPPIDCSVLGINICLGAAVSTDSFDRVLYDSSSSVLGSTTTAAPGGGATQLGYFSSPITLAAGSTYRAAYKPTTTNTALAYHHQGYNASVLGNLDYYTAWQLARSTRTDGGAWTDSTTDIPAGFFLVIGAVDNGKTPYSYGVVV